MWKNIVEPGTPQMTILCMRIVCWIPKATNAHSEYVNTYCFPTATVVARTRLNVTLYKRGKVINTLKAKLNPICHLLALLGPHHILHVSRIRVK